MTLELESAIKHCEEVAEENEYDAKIFCAPSESNMRRDFLERASEHRQLAEWLKELKAYREAEEEINRQIKIGGQWSDIVKLGMGRALVIMRKHIMEVSINE